MQEVRCGPWAFGSSDARFGFGSRRRPWDHRVKAAALDAAKISHAAARRRPPQARSGRGRSCPGSRPGPVLVTTSRSPRSGPQPPRVASAAHQRSVWPSRKWRVTCRHRPGLVAPRQPRSPAASTGVWAWSAGAQVPLRGLSASTNGTLAAPSAWVVAVETVGDHGPEREVGLAGGVDQLDGQLRLGPEPRVPVACGKPRGWGVRDGMHRPIAALVGPEAGHGDDAVVGLADRAQVLAPTCAVAVPSLRSPVSSITNTPRSCGAVAGSAHSSCTRRSLMIW